MALSSLPISLPHQVSPCSSISLFPLYVPFSFSTISSSWRHCDLRRLRLVEEHVRAGASQRTSIGGKVVSQPSKCCKWRRWVGLGMGEHGGATTKRHSLIAPTTSFGLKMIHLNVFFLMVSSIWDETTRISVQIDKTLAVDPSQTEPYFNVTISYC